MEKEKSDSSSEKYQVNNEPKILDKCISSKLKTAINFKF